MGPFKRKRLEDLNPVPKPKPKPKPPPVIPPVVTPPAPIIVPARDIIVGAWSFCGFEAEREEYGKVPGSQCPKQWPWNDTLHGGSIHLVDKDGSTIPFDRKSVITSPGLPEGADDQRDPAVMDRTLANMARIPITDLAHQFEVSWAHMDLPGTTRPWWATDYPGQPYMMEHFIKHHTAANTPVKLSASFWQRIVSADDARTYFEKEIDGKPNDGLKAYGWTGYTMRAAWRRLGGDVGEWMKSPNWRHVDGKPVFTLGYAHTLPLYKTWFPDDDADLSPTALVKIFRDTVREVTGKEVYLMATATPPNYINPADESIFSPDERMSLREWNFDGFVPYLLHGKGWDATMSVYAGWRDRDLRAARVAGLDYWPAITAGYNARAWQLDEYKLGYTHMPTPIQLTEHVRETIAWAIANRLKGVRIYALRERGEGGEIDIVSADPQNWVVGDEHLVAVQRGVAA